MRYSYNLATYLPGVKLISMSHYQRALYKIYESTPIEVAPRLIPLLANPYRYGSLEFIDCSGDSLCAFCWKGELQILHIPRFLLDDPTRYGATLFYANISEHST